jgi:hypothetical protein
MVKPQDPIAVEYCTNVQNVVYRAAKTEETEKIAQTISLKIQVVLAEIVAAN